jgi:hypothetical protein
MIYSGKDFSEEEINWIRKKISEEKDLTRHKLSRIFCDEFNWRKKDGGLKDMSCRVAFLKMEKDGIIVLPSRKGRQGLPKKEKQWSLFTGPGMEITSSVGKLEIETEIVDKNDSSLWNEYIERYHYLGYTPLPGAQMRYFVRSGNDIIALLGFGASAWKTNPRDSFIGWKKEQREKNLHLIVNNNRFLILPWIKSRNLATKILSLISHRLPDDWDKRYNYRPVLLETFVQKDRFAGTCYKASNWIYLGDTKGRGKKDAFHKEELPVKSVWVYPLTKGFREELCSEN